MGNIFSKALQKIIGVLKKEKIEYMIVGGFAVSFHNRSRTTNDIDMVIRIQSDQVRNLLTHFPDWEGYEESFKSDIKKGIVFNIVEFEIGMRYDFMPFQDTAYGRAAFDRKQKVEFYGVKCWMASKEDLILSKIRWYNISPSDKQLEDIQFLLTSENLDFDYIKSWVANLNLNTDGILG